jgi:NitT/TauT family transport system substrate-binding protein
MNKRLFRIFTTLLLSIVLLSACTGTNNANKTKGPLRVAWSLWPGYYPMIIAQEKGFFEKHGVQVEPVFYSLYNNQLPDLASSLVDGAVITLSDTMFDSISSSVKVVLVLDNSAGANQIIANSKISRPQDIRGKRIGVSRATVSGLLLVRQMLQSNGIDPSEVTLVEIPPEKVPNALQNTIDLGYTYDPFTSQAITQGGKVIFSSADAPGLIVDVLAMRKEIVEERPEDVKAFVAAWLEAVDYWKSNPAEGNALIAKATGLKPEEVSSAGADLFDLDANQKTFIPGTTFVSLYHTTQSELQFLVNAGDVTKPINVNELIDPTFIK